MKAISLCVGDVKNKGDQTHITWEEGEGEEKEELNTKILPLL